MPIYFSHVGRGHNKLADWLTNVPRILGRDVNIFEIAPGLKLGDDPPFAAAEVTAHIS